jgi:hypothetical protein
METTMSRTIATALIVVCTLAGAAAAAAATATPRQACMASGGKWDADKSMCIAAASGDSVGGGATPQPVEGTTITGCVPLGASGDPLKGLNVSKGGTNTGGQLCP